MKQSVSKRKRQLWFLRDLKLSSSGKRGQRCRAKECWKASDQKRRFKSKMCYSSTFSQSPEPGIWVWVGWGRGVGVCVCVCIQKSPILDLKPNNMSFLYPLLTNSKSQWFSSHNSFFSQNSPPKQYKFHTTFRYKASKPK